MNFKKGDKVRYYFPEPINSNMTYFEGTIESVTHEYILVQNAKKVWLKISFKYFENITFDTKDSPLKNPIKKVGAE